MIRNQCLPRPDNDSACQSISRTCQEIAGPLASRIGVLKATLQRAKIKINMIHDHVAIMESRCQAFDANNSDNPQLSEAGIVTTFAALRSDVNNLL